MFASVAPVFITVFLIVMITATAVTFILPESYAGTARVRLDPKAMLVEGQYNPQLLQTEFEVIQSQVVLEKVIEKLDLNTLWGKKYYNGESLRTAESLEILKHQLNLAPVRSTWLIAITIYSESPPEAAQLANAIAEAYQDYAVKKYLPGVVQIMDRAFPGREPVKPNKPLNLALGAVAGIILGGAIAAIVGFLKSRPQPR